MAKASGWTSTRLQAIERSQAAPHRLDAFVRGARMVRIHPNGKFQFFSCQRLLGIQLPIEDCLRGLGGIESGAGAGV